MVPWRRYPYWWRNNPYESPWRSVFYTPDFWHKPPTWGPGCIPGIGQCVTSALYTTTYIYIYIYIHIYMYTYIYVYVYTYIYIYMYMYIHIYIYTYICITMVYAIYKRLMLPACLPRVLGMRHGPGAASIRLSDPLLGDPVFSNEWCYHIGTKQIIWKFIDVFFSKEGY